MMIADVVIDAILSKMRNSSMGFNARVAALAPTYNVKPWKLDVPAGPYAESTNSFFLGYVSDAMSDNGPLAHNHAMLYTISSVNKRLEKPRHFAGPIVIGLDFNLAWSSSDLKQNFERHSLLVENAVTDVLQPRDAAWGAGVVYDGEYSCTRTPVDDVNDKQVSAVQKVLFRFTFEKFN